MNKMLWVLILFAFSGYHTQAQEITGTWSGVLNVHDLQRLTLVFHIKDTSGVLSATMDSPDQHALGIPVSKIAFNALHLHLEAANGVIVYDGKFMTDSIKGIFRQNGMSLPLVLYKGRFHKKAPVRPQQPKPPFSYKSEDVQFTNEKANIKLAGTLTLPKQGRSFPAAILIWGSGPNDRDETIAEHKPFLVIADYLTRKGLAVLRFDKRGVGKSGGVYQTATTADFASDVRAAVQYLETRPEINHNKMGLIGHSEGGIIAPMVAAGNKKIDFIVLLAGPGFDGAELLLMQEKAIGEARGIPAKKLKQQQDENRSLFQIIKTSKNPDSLTQELSEKIASYLPDSLSRQQKKKITFRKIRGLTGPWMKYFLINDPADYLKKVECPVLAMDGTKDLQVPAASNLAAIKKALTQGGNKRVTTKIFPDLNHLFQKAKTGLPIEYGKIEQTFSPEVLEYMGDWILEQVK